MALFWEGAYDLYSSAVGADFRGDFATAYLPTGGSEPGDIQAIYEFQTLISRMTGIGNQCLRTRGLPLWLRRH